MKLTTILKREIKMFDGKLNQFCTDVNKVVRSKGFWDSMDNGGYAARTHQDSFPHNKSSKTVDKDIKDAFISQKIALIMSECGESLEAMRKDRYGLEQKDTFEDELADVFIRLSNLCGELNIDIEKQIEWKLNHNKSRPAKHGKNF